MAESSKPTSKRAPGQALFDGNGPLGNVPPYVLTKKLGSGAFATVYKAQHHKTADVVAIKTVRSTNLGKGYAKYLDSEIKILASVNFKHITKLISVTVAPPDVHIVMEFCSGGDLTNYIFRRGKVDALKYVSGPDATPQFWPHPQSGGLDFVVVRSFLGQLASAIRFLRKRNLVHRDIKPQNLLLCPSDPIVDAPIPVGVPLLKLADFGLARSLPSTAMADTLCGTPLYMAPEVLRHESYEAKADLWSVGTVVYEMAVGNPPFHARNHIELLDKVVNNPVSFPDEAPSTRTTRRKSVTANMTSVPLDIKALVRRLLKPDPADRADFKDFFEDEAVKAELGLLDAPKPTPRPNRPRRYAADNTVPAKRASPAGRTTRTGVKPMELVIPRSLSPITAKPPHSK